MVPERIAMSITLVLLFSSLLCRQADCVRAGALPFQGLESPLLVGVPDVEPIDIGGDGVTDFVCVGRFVFEGTTRLDSPMPPTDSMVRVIIRSGEGEWRVGQSFPAGGNVQWLSVVDLNADGLDDLLLTTRVYPIHTLTCYLQTLDGSLVPSGSTILSETDTTRYPQPVGDDSGRVLVLKHGYSAEGPALVGELLQFDPTSGFRSLWTDSLRTDFGFLYPRLRADPPHTLGRHRDDARHRALGHRRRYPDGFPRMGGAVPASRAVSRRG